MNCLVKKLILSLCIVVLSSAGALYAADEEGTIRARAVFVGEIMIHDQQLQAARNGGSWDFNPQFRRVRPLFWHSLSIGSLETVFAGEEHEFAGYPEFNTPDELAAALADLGINIVMLANNHILGRGWDAALRTTKVLDEAGIFWTGLTSQDDPDEPLVVEYGGLRWAFVNFTNGSDIKTPARYGDLRLNIISDEAIVSGLARALTYEPDITVAFLHWGLEYQYSPSKSQSNTAALCLGNGADLVIGSHPHVLQPIVVTRSYRGHSAVAYSLGSLLSFQRTEPRERGAIMAVDVEKKPEGRALVSRISVAPTWVSARNEGGRLKVETVYAGSGGPFNHAGLPAEELASAREAGRAVLDFLGARTEPDPDGFYTLWDAASPDVIPQQRRETP
ncbi:MAG: CapA family protein [Synergistaceae bacterium]|nr:CapA family protein [Synergistaceae bacterium]